MRPSDWTGQRLSPIDMLLQTFWPHSNLVPLGLPCILNKGHHTKRQLPLGTRSCSRVCNSSHYPKPFSSNESPTRATRRQEINYQFCEAEPSNSLSNDRKGRMRQWTRMFPFSSYNNKELSTPRRLAQQLKAPTSEIPHRAASSVLLRVFVFNFNRFVP